ncbi:MAG: ribosome maturation factor RimM [Vulcanimicrobiota bacterium]
MSEELSISIGVVTGLHGVRGEFKVKVLTDFPERFAPDEKLRMAIKEGDKVELVTLESVRAHKKNLLVRLKGVETREQASRYIGGMFQIDESELMPLPENSFYHHEILGMEARYLDGELLGKVDQILETPHHDIYVVKGSGEHLIPALKTIVKKVEPGTKTLWIDREMSRYYED